ncbi:hypothetical protein BJ165DRAFT_791471 [Panaeolus papilionaceus]|nr:hypothetical protein BJ165DRAFT_791471 [Panaeolus papilionaceus]
MSDSSSKPSVLVFGGLNTCSRALAAFLVPVDAEPLVSRLRVVDKYSVAPPTTYIGPDFAQVLQSPLVEYKQANLTNQAAIHAAFEPADPSHPPFDYVFDFTGEVRYDRNEVIQISTTFGTAKLLGQEAASRNVKAYVRISQPFYETTGKQPSTEKDDIKPVETLGIWWHEAQRLLGSIEGSVICQLFSHPSLS